MGDLSITNKMGDVGLHNVGANSERTQDFQFAVRLGDQMLYVDQKGLEALKTAAAVEKAGPGNEHVYKMRADVSDNIVVNKI
jgi:hypothetical protein